MRWQIPTGTCGECGFAWSGTRDDAIRTVGDGFSDVARHFELASMPPPEHARSGWSAVGYVWHLVDVIRLGAERLRYFQLVPSGRFPGWDADAMATTRRYELLPLAVGLASLQAATGEWLEEAAVAPGDDVLIEHGGLR